MENKNKPITFSGVEYPKYNNAVIVLGGAGSDKKSVVNDMMSIEGEVFSNEKEVEYVLKSDSLKERIRKIKGIDLDSLDQTNPLDMAKIYRCVKECTYKTDDSPPRVWKFVSDSDPEKKPNIIMQDSVKDGINFYNETFSLRNQGYESKNIHIVWVIEDYEDIKKRNLKGIDGRIIYDLDLKVTHEGNGRLLKDILKGSLNLSEYMDGDIWLVFNKDNIIHLKKSGSPLDKSKITEDVVNNIVDCVPVIRKEHVLKSKTKKELPTIQDFLGDRVNMHEITYGGSIFSNPTNKDFATVAKIPGFLANISRHIGENEYDSDDILNFQLELTRYITDAINEKLERERIS